MYRWMLSGLLFGLLPVSLHAQDLPPSIPPPVPPGEMFVPPPSPGCVTESHKTNYELHWLTRTVPAIDTKYKLRELKTTDIESSYELRYKPCEQIETETKMKPRECFKEVTICTQKPIVTVDPITGCSKIIYEPVTETKIVKEIVYDLVQEQKVRTVRSPYLEPTLVTIHKKSLTLDIVNQPVMRPERFGVLVPVEIHSRRICPPPPPPPCTGPGCPK